jgi:hypothetical protein
MKRSYKIFFILVAVFLFGEYRMAEAAPNVGQPIRPVSKSNGAHRLAGGCAPNNTFIDLNVNDVRARIFNVSDKWWDLIGVAQYEVPKVDRVKNPGAVSRTSLFAGALWIGGFVNNNLKEAAMTYRQNGYDFFPGPLDLNTASISDAECSSWNQLFSVTSKDITTFKESNGAIIPQSIANWPAHGLNGYDENDLHDHYLAPFVDVDRDGKYNPEAGDYPAIYGDQALWYVYNDKGGPHTETSSDAIGLECQEMAFAFATNDELNDMTFYSTTVINRSKNKLDSCYFGQWVDADLGFAFDDYVAVDVSRSMGICYNGENFDPGVTGYGANPPSVGVDFFKGPIGDDGKELGMKKFVYYNNDFSVTGNPSKPIHYYYYLTGHWTNGDCIKYGNDGFKTTGGCTDYMFPGDPENLNPQQSWSEKTANNKPGDRRFLQSSGPFSLKPGARNDVTIGVVWARATSGGAIGSLDLLKVYDDAAQQLYLRNFKPVVGPTAPEMTIRESDRKLIISLDNTFKSDIEKFVDTVVDENKNKIVYKFQGYQLYQVANSSVNGTQLNQPDLARLIGQVDIQDNISDLFNQQFDNVTKSFIKVPEVQNAGNAGIRHTFIDTTDQFASGTDQNLVNYKTYYFTVVAYAAAQNDPGANIQFLPSSKITVYVGIPHKNNAEFNGTQLLTKYGSGPEIMRLSGQGNGGNILDFTKETEDMILANGKVANPVYLGGHGPVNVNTYDPTQVQPGDFTLKIVDSTLISQALVDNSVLEYNNAKSFVHRPLFKFRPTAWWYMDGTNGTDLHIKSDTTIDFQTEQLIKTSVTDPATNTASTKWWGLAVMVNQPYGPGMNPENDPTNGFLEATLTYQNEIYRWLDGVQNIPAENSLPANEGTPGNWIRVGRVGDLKNFHIASDAAAFTSDSIDKTDPNQSFVKVWEDPNSVYGNLLGGIIAPAALCARSVTGDNNTITMGPIPSYLTYDQLRLFNVNSIDLVFTPDQNKWSKCVVLEMGESQGLNEGFALKFNLRAHASWDKGVNADGSPSYVTSGETGRSWFPGYAMNLETGDRLNVFFGEDSHLPGENGADMLWNPTSSTTNPAGNFLDYNGRYLWGGKHWIYVMNSQLTQKEPLSNKGTATAYDSCNAIYAAMQTNVTANRQNVLAGLIWVMEPRLQTDFALASLKDGIIPNEARIRLRVSRPYATEKEASNGDPNGMPLYSFSTTGLAPKHTADLGKSALDLAGVVPNPYYAISAYENSQLDNRVKLINLPTKCEVKIYTLDGTLVRKFDKDDSYNTSAAEKNTAYPTTFIDWDLKNDKGIPIASGVYLIHINAYDKGEKVLKWFGVMKPIDLDTF